MQLSQLSFFVLDEADRMVERGHFRELQTIMDILPKTQQGIDAENEKPPQRRKRRRENQKEDEEDEEQGSDDEQENDENVEVYPDSDDDIVEEDDEEDPEVDEMEGSDEEQGDEEEEEEEIFPAFPESESESDEDQQIVAEDISMDAIFPGPAFNVEPMKKRQTLVFSATLALPPGFKKKLKRGFFEDKSVLKKNEYSVASLIQKAAMRSDAAIVDLTTKDILAKKLEESVIE